MFTRYSRLLKRLYRVNGLLRSQRVLLVHFSYCFYEKINGYHDDNLISPLLTAYVCRFSRTGRRPITAVTSENQSGIGRTAQQRAFLPAAPACTPTEGSAQADPPVIIDYSAVLRTRLPALQKASALPTPPPRVFKPRPCTALVTTRPERHGR